MWRTSGNPKKSDLPLSLNALNSEATILYSCDPLSRSHSESAHVYTLLFITYLPIIYFSAAPKAGAIKRFELHTPCVPLNVFDGFACQVDPSLHPRVTFRAIHFS